MRNTTTSLTIVEPSFNRVGEETDQLGNFLTDSSLLHNPRPVDNGIINLIPLFEAK
jgi:hypothetical protein